ncbi:protein of unknown function (plasmid) [Caballeronia sp. S22]
MVWPKTAMALCLSRMTSAIPFGGSRRMAPARLHHVESVLAPHRAQTQHALSLCLASYPAAKHERAPTATLASVTEQAFASWNLDYRKTQRRCAAQGRSSPGEDSMIEGASSCHRSA